MDEPTPSPDGQDTAGTEQSAATASTPAPYFENVCEFVEQWLLPTYRRSVRGHDRVWCPRWWEHAEALSRLDALWRAWEVLRLDPGTGLSVWWRDHCDHHMTVLLDANGPFKGCEDGHSDRPLEQLQPERPPAGMFERELDGLPDPPPAAARFETPPAARPNGGGGPSVNPRTR
jgi:hypothetical protein